MCKEISKHEIFFSFSLSANFSLPGRVIMRNHFSSSVSWCVISRFLVPGAEMVTWSHCGDPDFLARLSTSTSRLLPTRGEKNGKLDTDKIYKIKFVHWQISIFYPLFSAKKAYFSLGVLAQYSGSECVKCPESERDGARSYESDGAGISVSRSSSPKPDFWQVTHRSQEPDSWQVTHSGHLGGDTEDAEDAIMNGTKSAEQK